MPSLTDLKKKVLHLKNSIARDSITPISLGTILEEQLDGYSESVNEATAAAESAADAADAARSAQRAATEARDKATLAYSMALAKLKPWAPAEYGRKLHRGVMPLNAVPGFCYVRYYNGASKTGYDDVRFALPRGYNAMLEGPEGCAFELPDFLVGRSIHVVAVKSPAMFNLDLGGELRPLDEYYTYEVKGDSLHIKYTEEFLELLPGADCFPFLFVVARNFGKRLGPGEREVQWIDRTGRYRTSEVRPDDSYPVLPAPQFSRRSAGVTVEDPGPGRAVLIIRRRCHFGKNHKSAHDSKFTPGRRNRHYLARVRRMGSVCRGIFYAQYMTQSRYKSPVVKISIGGKKSGPTVKDYYPITVLP